MKRTRSWLTRSIALATVPIIVLALPAVANATTTYGSAASVTLTVDDVSGPAHVSIGSSTSCGIAGYWQSAPVSGPGIPAGTVASSIDFSGHCSTGFSVASSLVELDAGCGGTFYVGQVDGGADTSGTFVGPVTSLTTPCSVTQLCMSVQYELHGTYTDQTRSVCEPWGIGYPPVTTGGNSCALVEHVGKPQLFPEQDQFAAQGSAHFAGQASIWHVIFTSAASGGSDWVWTYVVIDPRPNDDGWFWTANGNAQRFNSIWGSGDTNGKVPIEYRQGLMRVPSADSNPGMDIGLSDWSSSGYPYLQSGDVIGMGMIIGGDPSSRATYPDSAFGLYGVSDPSRCSFYWGAKVVDIPGTTTDEPLGDLSSPDASDQPPVATPPPTDQGGCDGFSFTDPTSWVGSAMCAVVAVLEGIWGTIQGVLGVLQSVLSAIATLASSILGGLSGLLGGLFIPSVGNWPVHDLLDSWNSRPPGSLIDSMVGAVGGLVSGLQSGGGCSLDNWVVRAHKVGTNYSASTPMDCPKSSSSAYLAVYDLVKAGLLALTGLYVFHIARSAVGNGGGGA
jgi:hypothetical protein